MKTKESIAAYNKEYFARPEVIARALGLFKDNIQVLEQAKVYLRGL